MQKSLKDKFKSLRNRCLIDDAEYRSMCKKLDKHDSELLDKVAEKLKAKYPIYFNEFGMVINNTLQEDIDEVIVDIKAEVLNGK